MFQGHRGANQPVKNLINLNNVEITSQNHGFEVDRFLYLMKLLKLTCLIFDGSNEGIKHKIFLYLVFNITQN